jgi:hypothetical protein
MPLRNTGKTAPPGDVGHCGCRRRALNPVGFAVVAPGHSAPSGKSAPRRGDHESDRAVVTDDFAELFQLAIKCFPIETQQLGCQSAITARDI